jgi:hypothetical protein
MARPLLRDAESYIKMVSRASPATRGEEEKRRKRREGETRRSGEAIS